jgi:hypothetical protein
MAAISAIGLGVAARAISRSVGKDMRNHSQC